MSGLANYHEGHRRLQQRFDATARRRYEFSSAMVLPAGPLTWTAGRPPTE